MTHDLQIRNNSFLITGGAGFVGSHVVDLLFEHGAKLVRVLDTVPEPANLSHRKDDARLEYVAGSLLDRELLRKAVRDIDGLFHMATLPLGPCTHEPDKAVEINVAGSFAVFREAADAGVRKIVYSSASSVYGDTLETMDESHPFHANTVYGVSKLCGEFFLQTLKDRLSYCILRYMNVYGPRQTGGLIPNVIRKVKAGEAPVINGDGSASFDFVHVTDVARCNLLAMQADVTAEAFNVGSGEEKNVREIVETVLRLADSRLKPVYQHDGDVPMFRRVGNSAKAGRLLGFRTGTSFDEGIRNLIQSELSGAAS